MNQPVAIVGAGLAGLACALELQRRQIPFQIFEASDAVGGRVRTDSVDGFLLDRGFQVYLTAYPEGQRVLDYEALRFGRFLPGALIRVSGKFHRAMDPWREPFAALASILNPVGNMADKLRVARLRATCMAGSAEDLLAQPETTAMQALRNYGFTENMIERFFQPFFGGIMLDAQLRSSSRMLEFVFRMMAAGDTVLPAMGMGAIPDQLAARLPKESIHLGRYVKSLSPRARQLEDGSEVEASAVVVAVEGPEANRLIPSLAAVESRKVMTLYFAVEGAPPIADPIVALNGNLEWPIHNLCVPSVVCPSYAPPGQHLVSVTVLGEPKQEDPMIEGSVRSQMERWFGPAAKRWRLLKMYRIAHGHPASNPPTASEKPVKLDDGLFICGDHRYFPGIHAALVSGRHAAEAVASEAIQS